MIETLKNLSTYLDITILKPDKGNGVVNPLLPSAHRSARIAKISTLKLEGISKKFPMSVATKTE